MEFSLKDDGEITLIIDKLSGETFCVHYKNKIDAIIDILVLRSSIIHHNLGIFFLNFSPICYFDLDAINGTVRFYRQATFSLGQSIHEESAETLVQKIENFVARTISSGDFDIDIGTIYELANERLEELIDMER